MPTEKEFKAIQLGEITIVEKLTEKDKIEIDIEGINAKELSQPAIDFYFNCSKEQRNILREYIAKSIQSQKQKIIEIIKNWSGIVNKEGLLKTLGEKDDN